MIWISTVFHQFQLFKVSAMVLWVQQKYWLLFIHIIVFIQKIFSSFICSLVSLSHFLLPLQTSITQICTYFQIQSLIFGSAPFKLKNLKFGMVVNWPKYCFPSYIHIFLSNFKKGPRGTKLPDSEEKITGQSNINVFSWIIYFYFYKLFK